MGLQSYPQLYPLLYPQGTHRDMPVSRIHLHLLSDSTGETLENIAKAAIGLFENVEAIRHFWPMVRSEVHLDRIMEEISAHPGLVLFTLTNHVLRRRLETRCRSCLLYTSPSPRD